MKRAIARLRAIDKELKAIRQTPQHHIPEAMAADERRWSLMAESNRLWDTLSKKQKAQYLS